jgi:arylsulfatase A-like enzyme
MRTFRLDEEPAELRRSYGGEFGQRCLLSRRLIERGVRFIEVSHNLNFINGAGWDTHNAGHENQYGLVTELDSAVSTLITDLESRRLLDKTLIVIGTEFGRPGKFDSGGGRGHQPEGFTLVLAGGGLRHRGAFGVTDDLSAKIVEDPVSVADFHATVHAALGIDPAKNLGAGSRPVPITDGGRPIAALFS